MNEELVRKELQDLKNDVVTNSKDFKEFVKEHNLKHEIFERDLQKEMLDMREKQTQGFADIHVLVKSMEEMSKTFKEHVNKGDSRFIWLIGFILIIATQILTRII